MESITAHLLTLHTTPTYSTATKTHPFLTSAGDGTLTDTRLSIWLSQDRIYAAQAYPRFIGSLISHIPFDKPLSGAATAVEDDGDDHSQRILKILVFSLENIIREVDFFDATTRRWSLDVEGWKARKGTRDYVAEMASISKNGRIEEGLLFLWAMEKVSVPFFSGDERHPAQFLLSMQVYLDAWSNIHDEIKSRGKTTGYDFPLKSFAENWSTPEFKTFVDDLARLVDDIYRHLGEDAKATAERIWERVVELEDSFWPTDGEEITLRR